MLRKIQAIPYVSPAIHKQWEYLENADIPRIFVGTLDDLDDLVPKWDAVLRANGHLWLDGDTTPPQIDCLSIYPDGSIDPEEKVVARGPFAEHYCQGPGWLGRLLGQEVSALTTEDLEIPADIGKKP